MYTFFKHSSFHLPKSHPNQNIPTANASIYLFPNYNIHQTTVQSYIYTPISSLPPRMAFNLRTRLPLNSNVASWAALCLFSSDLKYIPPHDLRTFFSNLACFSFSLLLFAVLFVCCCPVSGPHKYMLFYI